MRAARYPTSGRDRGRIRVDEVPTPRPGPGEVLVRIHVSGVNPTDWKARLGSGLVAPAAAWVTPHHDGAGVIAAVGDGVSAERIGQRVWLHLAQWQRAGGTAAEWSSLPADRAVPLPDAASFALGAGLGIPAMTAHRCLFADGDVAGRTVLVHGGAGAVGRAAIELAIWGGARVAATVSSPAKARLAAAADVVVDYRAQDVGAILAEWAPGGIDRIVDVDLAANLELDARLVAPGGVIAAYAVTGTPVTLPAQLMTKNATLRFMLLYTMGAEACRAAVADLTEAVEQGALSTLPGRWFTLEETGAAHDALRAGAIGKVLIAVAGG